MPIWLRNFTFKNIQDFYVEQNKQSQPEGLASQTEKLKKTGENHKFSPPSAVKNAYQTKMSKPAKS